MQQFFEQIRQLNNKPLMFGIYGAMGCFLTTFIIGEPVYLLFENVIFNNQDSEFYFIQLMIKVGVWSGIVITGACLSLIVGQNYYLHRRLISKRELILALLGGSVVGFIAGAITQAIFAMLTSITESDFLMEISRIFSWTLQGMIVGYVMSFIIPNLKSNKGILGGALGGFLGCIGFIITSYLFVDNLGRLIGMTILGFFLGLMIALIEQISRQASVLIHWGPKEKTILSLGQNPVILGSSPDSHIYLRKDHGYPPITGKIYQQEDKIYLEFDPVYAKQKSMKKVKQELKNGDIRKFDKLSFEIQLSNPNLQKAT